MSLRLERKIDKLEKRITYLEEQLKDGLSEVTKRVVTNILREGLEAEVVEDTDANLKRLLGESNAKSTASK